MEKAIKDNGGPAFPLGSTPEEWMNGMTLRDYFAAKAMQGECSQPQDQYMSPERIKKVAEQSYAIADAMLKARES